MNDTFSSSSSSVLPHDDILRGILRHLTCMRDAKVAALSCRDFARIIRFDLLPDLYVNLYSRRALCRAAEDGQTYVLDCLIKYPLDDNWSKSSIKSRGTCQSKKTIKKAITGAAQHGRLDCVLLLLNYQGKCGGGCFRAAMESCKYGQEHVVKEMLTRGRSSWSAQVRAARLLRLLETMCSLEGYQHHISETLLLHVVETFRGTEQWFNVLKLMGSRVYRACTDQRRDACVSLLMACERAGVLPLDRYHAQSTLGAACRLGWTRVGQTVIRLSGGKARLTIEMVRHACEYRHLDTARWITGVCRSNGNADTAGFYSTQLLSAAREARLASYHDVEQDLLRMRDQDPL